MKRLLVAFSACSLILTSAVSAGSPEQPVMSPEVIIEEASPASGGGILVPLIFLVLVAAAATGGGSGTAISDARLKTDIVATGRSAAGLPLYQYRYIASSTLYEGVMAQDVLMRRPEAVVQGPMGMMMVDYGLLGLELKALD